VTTDPFVQMPETPRHVQRLKGRLRPAALALLLALAPWGGAFPDPPADDAAKPADQAEGAEKKPPEAKAPESKTTEKKATTKKPAEKKTTAPAAQPARQPAAAAKPEPPPLRFTDDDLDKLHRRAPSLEEDEETAEEPPSVTAGQAAPPGAGSRPGAARPAGKPPRAAAPGAPGATPPQAQPEPTPDLLQKFKSREAREALRKSQIEGIRNRIAQIQSRIDYLKARRTAVLNPLVLPPAPQTDADKSVDPALKPKELLAQIEAEIESLNEEIEEAQGSLVRLETSFAESGAR
jgi:hypothetical protein